MRLEWPDFIREIFQREVHYRANDLVKPDDGRGGMIITDGRRVRWESPLWTFTRLVKRWMREETTASEAWGYVAPQVARLGGWDVLTLDAEEAELEFTSAWAKIRYRPFQSPLDNAQAKAKAFPIVFTFTDGTPHSPRYNAFLNLAGWLQVTVGDAPIMLPVREVGALLGASQRTVALWRQQAAGPQEWLRVTRGHRYQPGGKGEATEFRFSETAVAKLIEHRERKLGERPTPAQRKRGS